MSELLAQVHSYHFCFQVSEHYDVDELSDLFETLESRGADYQHLGPQEPGKYLVNIPKEMRWLPFYRTVKECPSVKSVNELGVYPGEALKE